MTQSLLYQPAGHRRARWPFLLAAMAVAFSLTACGGDDDGKDAPADPSTPGQPATPPQPLLHCAP